MPRNRSTSVSRFDRSQYPAPNSADTRMPAVLAALLIYVSATTVDWEEAVGQIFALSFLLQTAADIVLVRVAPGRTGGE